MAWITCEFKSKVLGMPVEAEILAPQAMDRTSDYTENLKVIILLHGANWDRCEWLLKSHIFDLVRQQPILVVMPSGKNSFYINTANGYRYMDYITQELPDYIKKHFRVSHDRKDWLLAGESMGGYGAMVCGLNATEQFANIASFSGALDALNEEFTLPTIRKELIFGTDIEARKGSEVDVFALCHRIDESRRPNLFLNCGKQDFLYDMSVRFFKEVQSEYNVTATLDLDGDHNFEYWNDRLDELIPWFLQHSNSYSDVCEGGVRV